MERVRLHYVIALAWTRATLQHAATQQKPWLVAQKQGPLAALHFLAFSLVAREIY